MKENLIRKVINDNDRVRLSGTESEKECAEYLLDICRGYGCETRLEGFEVDMSDIEEGTLIADGKEIPCRAYKLCGSQEVTAPFLYLESTDKLSLAQAKGKIVLIDGGMRFFVYRDLLEAGIAGFVTYSGDAMTGDHDIDQKELRKAVSEGKTMPGVCVNAKDAFRLVKNGTKTVTIRVRQNEYTGTSYNAVAELPGLTDEWIILTAHYDTTFLSHGIYDNLTGCLAIASCMEKLAATAPNRRGVRAVFCGSEERGLLGSKAYAQAHEEELDKVSLVINVDMIGSVMGNFFACVTGESSMTDYLKGYAAVKGISMQVKQGVYSSDSTPFADKGVPAISFARHQNPQMGAIHLRYDTKDLVSVKNIKQDCGYIADFAEEMTNAVLCPIGHGMPDNMKKELDEYLNRKRKD